MIFIIIPRNRKFTLQWDEVPMIGAHLLRAIKTNLEEERKDQFK